MFWFIRFIPNWLVLETQFEIWNEIMRANGTEKIDLYVIWGFEIEFLRLIFSGCISVRLNLLLLTRRPVIQRPNLV